MDVRDIFKTLCDKVFKGETLIVSRPKNENIVMISEVEYNEIMKAKRNAEYLAMLEIMNIVFTPTAWQQYTDWQNEDKKIVNFIMKISIFRCSILLILF